MEADFVVHRNGALVAQLRDKPPRRKGVKVPEVAAALADMAPGTRPPGPGFTAWN
jgi:hypothetical protein